MRFTKLSLFVTIMALLVGTIAVAQTGTWPSNVLNSNVLKYDLTDSLRCVTTTPDTTNAFAIYANYPALTVWAHIKADVTKPDSGSVKFYVDVAADTLGGRTSLGWVLVDSVTVTADSTGLQAGKYGYVQIGSAKNYPMGYRWFRLRGVGQGGNDSCYGGAMIVAYRTAK